MKKSRLFISGIIVVMLIGVGLLLFSGGSGATAHESAMDDVVLTRVSASKAAHLEAQFTRYNYDWPPSATAVVPLLEIAAFPGDLNDQVVKVKKSLFFRAMLPLILAENHRIEMKHRWLEAQFAGGDILPGTTEWGAIHQVASYYRVKGNINDAGVRRELLSRVDSLPVAMVLAQAAQESGWGTSRFAREGNSLFGEWTFRKGAGITPSERLEGKSHTVRAFPTLRASVRSYMRNINVSRAYRELRVMRAEMRRTDAPFNAYTLASGLKRYSERGEMYVRDIRTIIKGNGLDSLGEIRMISGGGGEKPWMAVPVVSPGTV
ncbi:MAG: glucosaminidase domain-containing protein [Thermodesulfobacteriota bacterium]